MIVWLDFRQNPLKTEKWLFLALKRHYWMIQIFPGKNAVYVSCIYSKEYSCKKSEKSLARFSTKSDNGPRRTKTDNTKPDLNWRWEL